MSNFENPPVSGEKKEEAPITPESVLNEIHSRFSNSRELYEHVKKMVDQNFAMGITDPKSLYQITDAVLHRLASIRRKATYTTERSGMVDEEITMEDAKESFKSGALLGLMVGAVYYGEATFISNEGKVLSEPVEMKKG